LSPVTSIFTESLQLISEYCVLYNSPSFKYDPPESVKVKLAVYRSCSNFRGNIKIINYCFVASEIGAGVGVGVGTGAGVGVGGRSYNYPDPLPLKTFAVILEIKSKSAPMSFPSVLKFLYKLFEASL